MKAPAATFGLVHIAVVGLLTTAAVMTMCCTNDQTLSACTSSEQCNLMPGGECMPSPLGVDLCAYPNAECENTSLAWGQLSGELSGQCVVDHGAPAIVSRSPDDAATDVGTAINIAVEFNEPIDPASITPASFLVTQAGIRVDGTLNVSGRTAVFNSGVRLAPNATYSVSISTDVADRAGNKLASASSWSFSTRSGGWQAPQALKSDPNGEAEYLISYFDNAGHGAASWVMRPCSSATSCDTGSQTVWGSVYADGAWSTPSALTTSTFTISPNVTVDAMGRATAVWYEFASGSPPASVKASHYTKTSGWSSPVTLGQAGNAAVASGPSLAADGMGNVIAVWQERNGTASDLWWAKMAPDGVWGSPTRLENSAEAAYSPVVGVAPDGTAVAAWEQPSGSVRVSRYTNGAWGSSVFLRSSSSGYGIIRNAPNGSTHLVWFASTAKDIWWAQYASTWSAPLALDSSNELLYFNVELAFDPTGQGIAVWGQQSAADLATNAYFAIYDPNGGWSAAQTVEKNIGMAGDMHVAYGRSLSAMAMWIQPSGGAGYSVWSSIRTNATNKWSVPELAETDNTGDASRANVFFDPTQNVFHGIWMQTTSGKPRGVFTGSFE